MFDQTVVPYVEKMTRELSVSSVMSSGEARSTRTEPLLCLFLPPQSLSVHWYPATAAVPVPVPGAVEPAVVPPPLSAGSELELAVSKLSPSPGRQYRSALPAVTKPTKVNVYSHRTVRRGTRGLAFMIKLTGYYLIKH